MYRYSKLAIATLALCTVGGVAYAKKEFENDAQHVLSAKTTMAQAIEAAEKHQHGRASRAEYEHAKQGWVYDIEVVSGTKVYDVTVSAESGIVISSAEDSIDHDDDNDKAD